MQSIAGGERERITSAINCLSRPVVEVVVVVVVVLCLKKATPKLGFRLDCVTACKPAGKTVVKDDE